MVYTVEVRRLGHDLASVIAEMLAWLDYHGIREAAFGYSSGGPGIAFRISFSVETEALAFALAFEGRLNGEHPNGTALWTIGKSHPLDPKFQPAVRGLPISARPGLTRSENQCVERPFIGKVMAPSRP